MENTAIIFDWTPPSAEEVAESIGRIGARFPWLVLDEGGCVLGHAHTGPFKEKAAYDWAVETTLYLRPEVRGGGLGRRLHTALEEVSRLLGHLSLNACIAAPPLDCEGRAVPDEHLTEASIRFHEALDYRLVGRFTRCGLKFGKWYDMVWMERHIGEHVSAPPRPSTPQEHREGIEALLASL